MTTPKQFLSFSSIQANGWPESVRKLRKKAFDAYQSLPFPTTHDEDWRFTNVSPFLKTQYRNISEYAPARADQIPSELIAPESHSVVFLDGRFVAELSPAPKDIFIKNIHGIAGSEIWESYLGRIVPPDLDAFTAWNTAFFEDAVFIHVPDGTVTQKPVQILFYNTGNADAASFPRVLVVLGKQSQMTLVERFAGSSDSRYLTNAVTEIVLQESAVLQHVKVQQDGPNSLHLANSHVLADRNASYSSLSMSLGSELSRENLTVKLNGTGGDCTLNGLYMLHSNQHTDHHTTIDHAQPHGTSRELYKGILGGKSRGVFNGKVIVRKDAQKTDAEQMNKNLLLSDSARINTMPQLEILADDVKCRHGATIGHLDEDALFYLASRGIPEPMARTMLLKGFLQDVTGRIPEGSIRTLLEELVGARLQQFTGVNA